MWDTVMKENTKAKGKKDGHPIAQLAEFLRPSDKITVLD
jgi:hypothetical protein